MDKLKKAAEILFALLIDAQIVLAFSSYKPIHISCLMQHLTKGTMPSKKPKYPAWNCLNVFVGCKGIREGCRELLGEYEGILIPL